eukprot:augustus_masked-scaffold_8-processed-gene-1.7-mRNA-1 protein AED:1.00 eAED:1.00 QI:0/-1/0/0/-1/1/1/0/499
MKFIKQGVFGLCLAIKFTTAQDSQDLLQTCLSNFNVTSTFPGEELYKSVYQFQLLSERAAAGITFPDDEQDIRNSLRCATAAKVKVSVLAGQHSFVGYGFGDPGNLVISVGKLNQVSYDGEVVTFGAGARVATVAQLVNQTNGGLIAHVRGGSVGMVGSYIGGGFGITSRFMGEPTDTIVNVTYMLPCGRIETGGIGSDLLFASQGAGASYGVILSMSAKTWQPIYDIAIFVTVASVETSLSPSVLANLFGIVQEWGINVVPKHFAFRFYIRSEFRVEMQSFADPAEFNSTLAALMDLIPINVTIDYRELTPWELEVATAGSSMNLENGGTVGTRAFYYQSLTLNRELAPELYELLIEDILSFSVDGFYMNGFMDFSGGNSTFSDIKDTDTALHHGNQVWLLRFDGRMWPDPVLGDEFDWPEDMDSIFKSHVIAFEAALVENGYELRGFGNYRDRALSYEEWSSRLYGNNFQRLLSIKRKYDPTGMFTSNAQSIPVVWN